MTNNDLVFQIMSEHYGKMHELRDYFESKKCKTIGHYKTGEINAFNNSDIDENNENNKSLQPHKKSLEDFKEKPVIAEEDDEMVPYYYGA